jgi:hypothetical protein
MGLDCLRTMVIMAAKFFTVGNNGNHGKQIGLDLCTMETKLFTQATKVTRAKTT